MLDEESEGDLETKQILSIEDESPGEELSWNKLAKNIACAIHQLNLSAQKGKPEELQTKTATVVETVRLMLYASRFMEKDSQQVQDPTFREPRRAVMSSLSKLVLSAKMGSEVSEFSNSIVTMFRKVQRDANDVLVAVRNFITICQRCNITVSFVNPQLLDDVTQLPFEPTSVSTESVNQYIYAPLMSIDEKKVFSNASGLETKNSLTQKAKFLLNQDLVLNLQAYAHQICLSTEMLSLKGSDILKKLEGNQTNFEQERATAVSIFRTLSTHISQYIVVLDDINLDNIDIQQIPSISCYRLSRQSLYTAIGRLFGAIQTLTDINTSIADAVHAIDEAIDSVENTLSSIEESVVSMIIERRRTMVINREDYIALSPTQSTGFNTNAKNSPRLSFSDANFDQSETSLNQDCVIDSDLSEYSIVTSEDILSSKLNMRRATAGTIASTSSSSNGYGSVKTTEFMKRRRQRSLRTDDNSFDSNDTLGKNYHPKEIEFASDNTVKGGTLSALVERLTVHDTLGNLF